jgi:hypothetical protein
VISRVVQFAVGAQLRSDEEMIVVAWLRAGYAIKEATAKSQLQAILVAMVFLASDRQQWNRN